MPYDETGSAEEVLSTSKEEEQINKKNITATETEVEFSEEVKAWLIFNHGYNQGKGFYLSSNPFFSFFSSRISLRSISGYGFFSCLLKWRI